MTTQLPKGYEAVKLPEGAYDFCFDADGDLHFAVKEKSMPEEYDFEVLSGSYSLLGRPDELTEEQCREIVETHSLTPVDMDMVQIGDKIYTSWVGVIAFETAKEGLTHLLASLHLEPHTTIILKKENV